MQRSALRAASGWPGGPLQNAQADLRSCMKVALSGQVDWFEREKLRTAGDPKNGIWESKEQSDSQALGLW